MTEITIPKVIQVVQCLLDERRELVKSKNILNDDIALAFTNGELHSLNVVLNMLKDQKEFTSYYMKSVLKKGWDLE